MKKTIKLASIFLFFSILINYSPNAYSANSASVLIDGNKTYQSIAFAPLGNSVGLSLRDLTHIYNAFLEWKPISAVATLYINNKKIDVKVGDDSVYIDKKRNKLSSQSRLIGNDIFIPSDFLSMKDFAEITQTDS
ncbi:MAG: copper amine oxidase N-terminal domain-containing protein, partial [Elusimicrobiota bacterium]|nr:copper amine oxidase N-terminal domain-containing protein [Elusimicrobiota bacterium]